MKILVAQMNPTIGDLTGNTSKILKFIEEGRRQQAHLVLFPEMALCGYPPEDFLLLPHFCEAVEEHLKQIIAASKGVAVVVGTIRLAQGQKSLFNSAAVIWNGELLGYQDKILLPTYDVFDEARYFESGYACKTWDIAGNRVGITICEDIWAHTGAVRGTQYQRDPILELRELQPNLVLNLSASPFSASRAQTRVALCRAVAKTLDCPMVLCNQVGGNDSLIFDGTSLFVDPSGLLVRGKSFEEDSFIADTSKIHASITLKSDPIEDVLQALVLGVRDYFGKQGFTKAIIGLSGGVDSALVACIAAKALGPENVLGLAMPSRYSSEGSLTDAEALATNLNIDYKVISIEEPFDAYLGLLNPYFAGASADITEENLQSRIRGMLLMAFSNKFGYIVLATGNKSEMAMGYATLYGDMCGGLGVISDLTKQQVYALSHCINREKEVIPKSTLIKPPSAELRPNQLDSDSLPDYAIIDAVLEEYVENHQAPAKIAEKHGFPLSLVEDLVKRIHRSEYKRRQAPPGLRVSQKAFSVGRYFPIVQKWI
ncbi:MAG: NAD+ synthase [Chlamydiales bacterium]|nr:NAD+ synthase [Chlamydiales bacterium]